MNKSLSLLLVEDSDDDAQLIVGELHRAGYRIDFRKVDTKDAFLEALADGDWDAVICDYRLPQFDALEALRLFCEKGTDIPFLIVSGTVGEEVAVEAMRHGADDYIMKENVIRLVPALEGQLNSFDQRRRRISTEAALRESEQRFRLLAEKSRDLVSLTSPDGVIQYLSPSVRKLLGYAPEELLGTDFAALIHPDDRTRVTAGFDRALAGSANVQPIEYRLCRKDNVFTWFETLAEGVTNDAGRVSSLLCNSRDVSERREIEQRFRQVQKMESLGNLAGGIAHDFNNILAVINGYSELITNLPQADEQIKRFAAEINRGGERASQLVRQILTFARKTDTHFHALRVNEAITDICELLKETFPRSIGIRVELDESLPPIQADSQQVSQVLMNLAMNARDVMKGTGGMLTFSSETVAPEHRSDGFSPAPDTDYVCIRVSDTGFGMDEETCSRIFEPFFTTKEVGEGTGLGLAVVYGIMQNHGGQIEVSSTPGKGTVFRLYFPTARPQRHPEAAKPHFHEPIGGDETLLLVEDEVLVAEWLRWSLSKKGYRVLWANTATEALKIYEKERARIALVLSDHGLPGMSGWDLYLKLKEWDSSVPFVIATGYLDPSLRQGMLESGISGFLHKPFKRKELLHHIRHLLDTRAAKARE